MKYSCSITIDQPIDKVVDLWKDENNFAQWQDGFESIEHISGTPETEGAIAKIVLQAKTGRMELLETIITSNLPDEKSARYEHIHMINTQTSRFRDLGNNQTEYISEVEYTQFNGIMIKLMAKLFPGKFKEQSQKWMDQFKEFAEIH